MTDSEKLDILLSNMQTMQNEITGIKKQMNVIDERIDSLELQIKSTERTLKNKILKSELFILDEVDVINDMFNLGYRIGIN